MNVLTIWNGKHIGLNKMNKTEKENQEYYARKMKHRQEMLPYVAVCLVGIVLMVMVAAIVNILGGW